MKSILVFLSIITFSSQAQNIKQEINQQVWKNFIEAYNKFDTEKFMSLYSRNVVRVPLDQKQIFNYSEYKKNINRENQFNKNYNIKANLELRFIDRIHSATTAYESGIFKINIMDNTGKPATIYSKFQVLLRKENGMWKIEFDTDTSEGNTVDEKQFMEAQPMEE